MSLEKLRSNSPLTSVVHDRWSMGSALFLASWAVLMGPVTYVHHLISAPRLPFTVAYFGSIGLTLYFAIKVSRCDPSIAPMRLVSILKRWCTLSKAIRHNPVSGLLTHDAHMTASKNVLDPLVRYFSVSGAYLVFGKLFPDGKYGSTLCRKIRDQQIVGLDDGLSSISNLIFDGNSTNSEMVNLASHRN